MSLLTYLKHPKWLVSQQCSKVTGDPDHRWRRERGQMTQVQTGRKWADFVTKSIKAVDGWSRRLSPSRLWSGCSTRSGWTWPSIRCTSRPCKSTWTAPGRHVRRVWWGHTFRRCPTEAFVDTVALFAVSSRFPWSVPTFHTIRSDKVVLQCPNPVWLVSNCNRTDLCLRLEVKNVIRWLWQEPASLALTVSHWSAWIAHETPLLNGRTGRNDA
jgi:hypothetical protein